MTTAPIYRTPEEELIDLGKACGISVRLTLFAAFRVKTFSVIELGEGVTVVRSDWNAAAPYVRLSPLTREQFVSRNSFLTKLERKLARLGFEQTEPFSPKGIGLDGCDVVCRHRTQSGISRSLRLNCWTESPDREVRQLGDFLERLAQSSISKLKRQARLSRFW